VALKPEHPAATQAAAAPAAATAAPEFIKTAKKEQEQK
jgi:hypothetical protein